MTGRDRLNPSLQLDVMFRALRGDDDLTTVFPLGNYPDMAAWLHGFVDFRLSRAGKLPGQFPIPPPPGGETLERMIRGGIVLEEYHADGRRALSLNPEQNIWLNLKCRLAGGH